MTDAIKRYWVWEYEPGLRDMRPDGQNCVQVVRASDHDREVAGLREASDIRARQYLDDTKRLEADRDALQREVAELRAQAQHLGPFIRRYQRDGIWLVEHQVNLGGEQGTVTYAYLSDYDALQKRCGELEKALEKYGRHTKFCYAVDIWDSDKGCTCGFAALRPAEGEGPTSCETHGVDNCPTCPPAKRGEKP